MQTEQLISLTGLVLVMVGTPGPNNLMLMASGVNFGVVRSLPHVAGIIAGCQTLLLAMMLGLGQLLKTYPLVQTLLQILSALFLVYIAWLLAGSGRLGDTSGRPERPISFWQALLFQWINPKAWMICMAIVAAYTDPEQLAMTAFWTSLVLAVVSLPLIVTWNVSGQVLKYWLQQGKRLLWFNRLMALLLIGCLYPMMH
ncbi:LysE family translocator [Halomonadaceae bacterium KBTZ08]